MPKIVFTRAEYFKKNLELIDSIGTPNSRVNNPVGWAQATNRPFKDWKQDAHAEGGTHTP